MGKDKKEQKRLQEERMDEILSRLDSIENAVNENKQSVEENSAKIETTTEIATAVPVSKEEIQKESEKVEEEINEVKKLSLEDEFDLLMNNMISGQKNNEKRLKKLTQEHIRILKDTPGGLQFGILFLRAEDNMQKILHNQTFEDNLGHIRSLPAVHALIKTVDETSGLLRDRIGFGHRVVKNIAEGTKGMGNSVLNSIRGVIGKDKVDMVGTDAMTGQRYNEENLARNKLIQQNERSSVGGGRKTQRRKKHKKGGKYHKTRKHH